MLLGIIGWVIVGLIAGFIASKAVNLHGDDPRLGIGTAAGGAIVAGTLYTLISGLGVTPWNIWSLFFAAIGASAGAVTWHLARSRYVSREPVSYRRSN